jgi:putative hydrolase of the HAD superfamily
LPPIFKNFIFDLDRTLYPYASNVLPQIDNKIALYCKKICNVSLTQAHEIRLKYYKQYGATLTGLINEYHIDPDDFLDYVHDVDYHDIVPCQKLTDTLSQIKGCKIIYTNSTQKHTFNVLKKRNLVGFFDAIHDIRSVGLQPKPCPTAFGQVMDSHNFNPHETIFFDDSLANTKTAKQMGVYAVHVLEGKTAMPADTADISQCDTTIYSLARYLTNINHQHCNQFLGEGGGNRPAMSV